MYELIQGGERTYYIDCPAKIGIYKCSENEVYIIDSGNDKDAGKRILKILLPTILPIAIPALPRFAAVTEVTSSGSDVPKATIVKPINRSLIPK